MWVCRLPVHIGPADYTVFTEIFGEFVTSQRADVGIGPYNQWGGCLRICLIALIQMKQGEIKNGISISRPAGQAGARGRHG